jgi:hypothetical protein
MNTQAIRESVALSITPTYRELFNIKSLENEYVKSPDDAIFDYNPFAIEHQQAYNPIYSSLFECEKEPDNNLQLISFKQKYNFVNMNTIEELETNQYINKPVFIKFAPLLDPIKYMIGKYEKYGNESIPHMPKYNQSTFAKIDNIHNSSYVDCFFSYLSSRLLHDYGVPHGIDFLGCNLGIQSKYKMNIYDDLEYLNNSLYFNSNKGKLFQVSDYEESHYLNNISRGHKERLALNETKHNITNISIIDLDDIDVIDNVIVETDYEGNNACSPEEIYQKSQSLKTVSSSDSSNNSELNYSSDEEDEDEEHEDEDEEHEDEDEDKEHEDEEHEDDDSGEYSTIDEYDDNDSTNTDDNDEETEPTIFAYINNFPVQMICLEKCEGTLDELFTKKKIDLHTAASAMFQILMTLLIYQRAFQFTHNDLHTNNIMYVPTEEEYLFYEFNGKKYKVPTYGKIFKLIDFGRSIYKINGQIFCSDSFAPGGDAHTQYNFEPFFNENKPRLEPNYSFDLCRLGCSIYDFIIESDEDNDMSIDPENMDEFQKTIYRWCLDDNNKNVLYKKNGEERYPNFKLYKMIARTVHNHTPENQLSYPFFSQFAIDDDEWEHVVKSYENPILMNIL